MNTFARILLLFASPFLLLNAQDSKSVARSNHADDISLNLSEFNRTSYLNLELLDKAEELYENFAYAEAARAYKLAFRYIEPSQIPYSVLEKAAVSNYNCSKIKRSYSLYHYLFEQKDYQMTPDNLFKYIHTLKGVGRQKEAKRLQKKYEDILQEIVETDAEGFSSKYEITIQNLDLNSPFSEFSPMFAGDGKIMFASTRSNSFLKKKYKWNRQPFLDLYFARTTGDDNFYDITKLPKEINSKMHEASPSFSPDKKTMYFTRNSAEKNVSGTINLKIYKSEKIGDEWSKPRELPINNSNYSVGHPAVSPDGKKLFFVSDMPGGFGHTDIYVVDILENNTFSEPKNLGEKVNSSRAEAFPYNTESALYFSSNRSSSHGGLDIYMSTILDDDFLKSINIGTPFNSNRDDISFIIDETTNSGFFASNRKGGKGDDDIYSFELKEKINGVISGLVTEHQTDKIVSDAIIQLFDSENKLIGQKKTDENGRYLFENLPNNSTYKIVVSKENYQKTSSDIKLDNFNNSNELATIMLRNDPINESKEIVAEKINVAPVYFDFDKYTIRKEAFEVLDEIVQLVEKNPSISIKIESHTDARGSKMYNKALSDRRAKEIMNYLLNNGLEKKNIHSAIGFGEDKLLNGCSDNVSCTKEMHQFNRRTDFIVVQK